MNLRLEHEPFQMLAGDRDGLGLLGTPASRQVVRLPLLVFVKNFLISIALDLGDERIGLQRQRPGLQGQASTLSHRRTPDVDAADGVLFFQLPGHKGVNHTPSDVALGLWIVLEVAGFLTGGAQEFGKHGQVAGLAAQGILGFTPLVAMKDIPSRVRGRSPASFLP